MTRPPNRLPDRLKNAAGETRAANFREKETSPRWGPGRCVWRGGRQSPGGDPSPPGRCQPRPLRKRNGLGGKFSVVAQFEKRAVILVYRPRSRKPVLSLPKETSHFSRVEAVGERRCFLLHDPCTIPATTLQRMPDDRNFPASWSLFPDRAWLRRARFRFRATCQAGRNSAKHDGEFFQTEPLPAGRTAVSFTASLHFSAKLFNGCVVSPAKPHPYSARVATKQRKRKKHESNHHHT